jgi:hypothetical protein
MKIPEGRQVLSTHVDPKLHERVKVACVKLKSNFPTACDEAFKLWLDAQKNGG